MATKALPMRLAVIALSLGALASPASAQSSLRLFDAHMHYNHEPAPLYPLPKLLEVFRRNNVAGVLANSRPNTSRIS